MRSDLRNRVRVDELSSFGAFTFIKNDNIHRTGRCLRGLLVYTFHDIGYVVKASGKHAVYQPLLPWKGDMRLLNLYDPNVLPLQQVGGPLVYNESKVCVGKRDDNGFVCKSPRGPDRVFFKRVDIPSFLLEALDRTSFVNLGDSVKVPKQTYCPKFVPVLYVLTAEETRCHVDKSKGARRYSLPVGPIQRVSQWYVYYMFLSFGIVIYLFSMHDRFSFQDFVYVNHAELVSLQKIPPSSLPSAISDIAKLNPTVTRLVPNMTGNVLRIKLVDTLDGISGQRVQFGSWKYVFAEEPKSFVDSPGILVSSWWKCPSLKSPRISYKECRHWINCYGKGFGSRHSSGCVGLNVYTDDEGILSHRPHPDIWTDEKEIPKHQYCNQNFEFPLMRSLLEKRLHLLTKKAREKAHAIHGDMMDLIDGSCTKRIVTTGSAIRCHGKPRNKWGPNYFYSFCNEVHRDDCDLMTRFVRDMFWKRANNEYKKRILSTPKVCLPTTCAYQFSWRSPVDEVHFWLRQFFVMDGLGLAMPLEDGIAHHFLASLFSHHTSAAVLNHPNGDMSLGNEDPIALVFAWGNSGGPKNVISTHEPRNTSADTHHVAVSREPMQCAEVDSSQSGDAADAVVAGNDETGCVIAEETVGVEEVVREEVGSEVPPEFIHPTDGPYLDDSYSSDDDDGVGHSHESHVSIRSSSSLPPPDGTSTLPTALPVVDGAVGAIDNEEEHRSDGMMVETRVATCLPDRSQVANRSTLQEPIPRTIRRTSGLDRQSRTSGLDRQSRTSGLDRQSRTSGLDQQRVARRRKKVMRRRLKSLSEKYKDRGKKY